MNVNITPEALEDTLFFLEDKYREEPPGPLSDRLAKLLDTLRDLRFPDGIRIQFPTGNKDVDRAVAFFLRDGDLNTFCRLNRYTADLCRDELFWAVKIWQRYGVKLDKYLRANESQKEAYVALSKNYSLSVAAERGYLPVIKLANEENDIKQARASSLASIASDADHIDILEYLDSKFNIVDDNWIFNYNVAAGSPEILQYIIGKLSEEHARSSFLARTIVLAAHNKEDNFVRDIMAEYPDMKAEILRKVLAEADMRYLDISTSLLKELYPSDYVPDTEDVALILETFYHNPLVATNYDNLRYVLSLADNNPKFLRDIWQNIEEDVFIFLLDNVYHPERYVKEAIRRARMSFLGRLSAERPDLITNDDILLVAKNPLTQTVYDTIVDNLPNNYDYSITLLEQLSQTQLSRIIEHLGLDIKGDKNILIGATLQKIHQPED